MTDPIFLLLLIQFLFLLIFAYHVMSYNRLMISISYELLIRTRDFEIYEALMEDDEFYND